MIYIGGLVFLTIVILLGIKNLAIGHLNDDLPIHDLKDSEVER